MNSTANGSWKCVARKWYAINDQNYTKYGVGNSDNSSIKFKIKVIEANLCDHSDTYTLVTIDIKTTGGNANAKVVFKNCDQFFNMCNTYKWSTH